MASERICDRDGTHYAIYCGLDVFLSLQLARTVLLRIISALR
nr:MAG TPA: hypothetical protein [Caudoviricetes sp.]